MGTAALAGILAQAAPGTSWPEFVLSGGTIVGVLWHLLTKQSRHLETLIEKVSEQHASQVLAIKEIAELRIDIRENTEACRSCPRRETDKVPRP